MKLSHNNKITTDNVTSAVYCCGKLLRFWIPLQKKGFLETEKMSNLRDVVYKMVIVNMKM